MRKENINCEVLTIKLTISFELYKIVKLIDND